MEDDRSVFRSPVEVNILTRRDLANRRIAADRRPDLNLELAFSNIIAEELIVYLCECSSSQCNLVILTAVEATGELDVIGAMSHRTANGATVAPNHLRKVAPSIFVVWVVVRVLGLLLVPAVRRGAGELDPISRVGGSWTNGREVAAGAFLLVLAICRHGKVEDSIRA
jgi:hypothetical protein